MRITTYKKLMGPLQWNGSTYGLPSGIALITDTQHIMLLWLSGGAMSGRRWWQRLAVDVKSDNDYPELFKKLKRSKRRNRRTFSYRGRW